MPTSPSRDFPWAANVHGWHPDPQQLPMFHALRPNRLSAAAVSLGGLAATVMPFLSLIRSGVGGELSWGAFFLHLPFLITGSLILTYGMSRFFSRRLYTVRKDEVEYDELTFPRTIHWTEPLSRYEGVLREIRFYAGGRAGRSKVLYEISLKHRDPSRCIPLYRSFSWRSFDSEWRRFCKLFRLPGLEGEGRQITMHTLRELDRQAANRHKEAELWLQPPSIHLSGRIPLFRDGDRFVLRIGFDEIHFSHAGVEQIRIFPWGIRPVMQLPTEHILNILDQDFKVCLLGEFESLSFGRSLKATEREQIKNFLILVISHGPSKLKLAS